MKTHVIIGIILVFSGCFAQPESERLSQTHNGPSAGHVIVPIENIFAAGLGFRPVGWKIEESDVSAVETSINALFAKPDKRMKGLLEKNSKKAPFPLSDYYMQYAGAIKDGKKLIIGKGFHKSQSDPKLVLQPPEQTVDSVRSFHTVWGGGTYFFTVVYDVADNNILDLEYNAGL